MGQIKLWRPAAETKSHWRAGQMSANEPSGRRRAAEGPGAGRKWAGKLHARAHDAHSSGNLRSLEGQRPGGGLCVIRLASGLRARARRLSSDARSLV